MVGLPRGKALNWHYMTVAILIVGLILGIVSAALPLGPVTLLVLRRGMNQDWDGALRVGLGRVLPETIYCGLATFGAAITLRSFPNTKLWVQAIGALLLLVLGLYFLLAKFQDDREVTTPSRWGNWSGLIISALNPSLVLSWSAIAAIAIATTSIHPTNGQKLTFATGVGAGIALGYVILITTMRQWGEALNASVIRTTIRVVGAGFIAASIWNIVQLVQL